MDSDVRTGMRLEMRLTVRLVTVGQRQVKDLTFRFRSGESGRPRRADRLLKYPDHRAKGVARRRGQTNGDCQNRWSGHRAVGV
jgi:hypothetical protein